LIFIVFHFLSTLGHYKWHFVEGTKLSTIFGPLSSTLSFKCMYFFFNHHQTMPNIFSMSFSMFSLFSRVFRCFIPLMNFCLFSFHFYHSERIYLFSIFDNIHVMLQNCFLVCSCYFFAFAQWLISNVIVCFSWCKQQSVHTTKLVFVVIIFFAYIFSHKFVLWYNVKNNFLHACSSCLFLFMFMWCFLVLLFFNFNVLCLLGFFQFFVYANLCATFLFLCFGVLWSGVLSCHGCLKIVYCIGDDHPFHWNTAS
jgi:hypothetical protein